MGLETNYLKFINSVIGQASGKQMLELGNQSVNHSKRPEKTGKEYFTNNGFDHISVDRNGLDGSVKKDLRNLSEFREYVDFFDIVTNCGVTEHVEPIASQYTVFRIIHDSLKVGGIAFHILPDSDEVENDRWGPHCRFWYNERFFKELCVLNNYELLKIDKIDSLIAVAYKKISPVKFTDDIESFQKNIVVIGHNKPLLHEAVYPNTMVTRGKVSELNNCLYKTITEGVIGDYVECGTYRGGLSALMLDTILYHKLDKKLWVYDTFQGMSEPSELDISNKNEIAKSTFEASKNQSTGYADWCKATIDIVQSTLSIVSHEYEKYAHLIIGKVEDTLKYETNIPKKISLMRLDTDWYESTKIELEKFYHLLSVNGIIIIDDYRLWQGQKLAVDEFFDKLDKDSYQFVDGDDGSLIITKLK
jgi:hypothetical protein